MSIASKGRCSEDGDQHEAGHQSVQMQQPTQAHVVGIQHQQRDCDKRIPPVEQSPQQQPNGQCNQCVSQRQASLGLWQQCDKQAEAIGIDGIVGRQSLNCRQLLRDRLTSDPLAPEKAERANPHRRHTGMA